MNFRDIPGYEGFYQVSDCGQVMSLLRKVAHKGTLRTIYPRVLKLNTDKDGYKTVVLQMNGKAKTLKVHRLVALAFIGDSNLIINHKDCNKQNNNVENLEYVTICQNNKHARENVVFNLRRGENHPGSKLSIVEKEKIVSMIKNGVSRYEIGSMFGIHPHSTYKIERSMKCK